MEFSVTVGGVACRLTPFVVDDMADVYAAVNVVARAFRARDRAAAALAKAGLAVAPAPGELVEASEDALAAFDRFVDAGIGATAAALGLVKLALARRSVGPAPALPPLRAGVPADLIAAALAIMSANGLASDSAEASAPGEGAASPPT